MISVYDVCLRACLRACLQRACVFAHWHASLCVCVFVCLCMCVCVCVRTCLTVSDELSEATITKPLYCTDQYFSTIERFSC